MCPLCRIPEWFLILAILAPIMLIVLWAIYVRLEMWWSDGMLVVNVIRYILAKYGG